MTLNRKFKEIVTSNPHLSQNWQKIITLHGESLLQIHF